MHRLLILSNFVVFAALSFLVLLPFNMKRAWGLYPAAPQGVSEAIGGNVGLAKLQSLGGFLYNPASTASFLDSQISTSGSSITMVQFEVHDSRINDRNSQPSLNLLGGLTGVLYHFDWGNGGFYYNKSSSFSLYKFFEWSAENFEGLSEIVYTLDLTETGILFSRDFGPSLSLGAVLAYNQYSQLTTNLMKLKSVSQYTSGFTNTQYQTNFLMPKVGILYKQESWRAGFTWMNFGLPLFKNKNVFAFSVGTDGAHQDNSSQVDPSIVLPEELGLGIQIDLSVRTKFALDFQRERELKIDIEDRLIANDTWGLQVETTLREDLTWISGVSRSTSDRKPAAITTYISTGLSHRRKQITTMLGLYHSKYESPVDGNSSGTTINSTGLAYTASFHF